MNYIKLLILSVSIVACSEGMNSDEKLPGKRIAIIKFDDAQKADEQAAPIVIPKAKPLALWSNSNGSQYNYPANIELSAMKKQVKAKVLKTTARYLTATPVIDKNTIVLMDSAGKIIAYDKDNLKKPIWQKNLLLNKKDQVIGGGMVLANNIAYVASGQKDIVAINIENGKEVWRHTLDNVIRAAPIIQHDKLFVSTIDNKLYFLDLADGNTLWIHEGASENIGVFGAASIAADGNMIIVPHSSGQLHALNIYNGEEIWSVNLSYQKSNITGFAISDIDVTPVIRDNKIYISNNIGSLFAINLENGAPLWKREVRGIKSIWVAGEYLYVINEHKQIIAINRENGYIKWIEKIMPEDAKAKSGDKTKFVGPLMAQDQLIAAGNNGKLYFISPLDGKNIKTINIPSNISLMPVIADGNIYILDNSGYLSIL